ncbi:hypothetical protein [uncultured Sphingomonas sp.]|uniref:hypothetical protein n=1 Tax=uncultured Sphingomonas sp. TaxID=158754 RepID=UPI0037488231
MLRQVVIAAILPLSLAACGSKGSSEMQAAATNNAASANYLAAIDKMNENERNGVLFRAITDAGRACQGVTRSVAGPAIQGNPSWVATCEDGTPWVVSINAQGVATINAVAPTTPKAG